MTVEFNHTIVWAHDSKASAGLLSQMLGLPAPNQWGPFQVVATGNGVSVDFMDKDGNISMQHYAFWLAKRSSTRSLVGCDSRVSNIGPIRRAPRQARLTTMTADAASTSRIQMVICSRPSRGHMVAAGWILLPLRPPPGPPPRPRFGSRRQ